MILDSDTENSIEIYTLLADKNNHPVIIALRIDQKEQRPGRRNSEYVVNSIRSIYGKENHNTAINKLKTGYGRYINMKLAAFYETAFGVQFPGASSIKNSSNNIRIDESANVKPIFEKNQEKMRFSLKNGGNGLAHIEKRRGKKVKKWAGKLPLFFNFGLHFGLQTCKPSTRSKTIF